MVSEEVVESVSSSKFQADPEIYKFQSNKKAVIENSFFKRLSYLLSLFFLKFWKINTTLVEAF